jgi:hypothetical protein
MNSASRPVVRPAAGGLDPFFSRAGFRAPHQIVFRRGEGAGGRLPAASRGGNCTIFTSREENHQRCIPSLSLSQLKLLR